MMNVHVARMDSDNTWVVWYVLAGLVYNYSKGRLDIDVERQLGVHIDIHA